MHAVRLWCSRRGHGIHRDRFANAAQELELGNVEANIERNEGAAVGKRVPLSEHERFTRHHQPQRQGHHGALRALRARMLGATIACHSAGATNAAAADAAHTPCSSRNAGHASRGSGSILHSRRATVEPRTQSDPNPERTRRPDSHGAIIVTQARECAQFDGRAALSLHAIPCDGCCVSVFSRSTAARGATRNGHSRANSGPSHRSRRGELARAALRPIVRPEVVTLRLAQHFL